MTTKINDSQFTTIKQIDKFLNASDGINFEKLEKNKIEIYDWVHDVLVRTGYILSLTKSEKGLVKKYLEKLTNYSRAQVTRLIRQYTKTGYSQ